MVDVFENPDSTIGQIVERTGFPQSHVSASVARLRDSGMIVTTIDSEDRRRTLVGPSRAHLAKARESRDRKEPIDEVLRSVLTEEFGISGPDHLEELLHALDVLQRLLAPPLTRRPTSCAEGTPCSSD